MPGPLRDNNKPGFTKTPWLPSRPGSFIIRSYPHSDHGYIPWYFAFTIFTMVFTMVYTIVYTKVNAMVNTIVYTKVNSMVYTMAHIRVKTMVYTMVNTMVYNIPW